MKSDKPDVIILGNTKIFGEVAALTYSAKWPPFFPLVLVSMVILFFLILSALVWVQVQPLNTSNTFFNWLREALHRDPEVH